jgi:N4-(beta-N-acetylglucosaminyl)-L-asparaginase
VCGAFLAVEFMRRGMKPTDACLEVLKRVIATTEPRLLDAQGRPTFGLTYYALNKNGEFGAASFTPGQFAAWDGERAGLRDTAFLFAAARPS